MKLFMKVVIKMAHTFFCLHIWATLEFSFRLFAILRFYEIPVISVLNYILTTFNFNSNIAKGGVSRCYIKTKKIWAVKRQLGDGFVTLNCLYTTIFQLVSQQKSFIMSRLQNLCQLIAEAVMDVKPHACEYINAVYEEKHHLVIKLFGFEICPRGSCHSCKL